MKYALIVIVLVLLGGGTYWYGIYAGWWNPGPDNLPTEEEWERIREIERTSSERAPNAKAGVGVAAPGTLPPPPPPTPEATGTATTTEETATSTEDTEKAVNDEAGTNTP